MNMKNLLNYFNFGKNSEDDSNQASAMSAKERLRIIISHERQERDQPDFMRALQNELLEVIGKYFTLTEENKEQIKVQLDKTNNSAMLELNITLPDPQPAEAS